MISEWARSLITKGALNNRLPEGSPGCHKVPYSAPVQEFGNGVVQIDMDSLASGQPVPIYPGDLECARCDSCLGLNSRGQTLCLWINGHFEQAMAGSLQLPPG